LKKNLIPFLLIAAVEGLSFGPCILHRGFYCDDWMFLYNDFLSEGIWDAFRRMAQGGFWVRPVEILHYPLFYSLGLPHPVIAQAMLLALKIAEGCLFFRLLDRLLGWRELALWATFLALAYPNRSATHLWFANSPQGVSVVLVLISMLLHESWTRNRKGLWLAGSAACYLSALLSYESITFAPLLLGAGLAVRAAYAGTPWKKALLSAAKDLLPYGACALAALLWMWAGVSLLLRQPNPKPLFFSLKSILAVYVSGLACLTNRPLGVCIQNVPLAFRHFPPLGILLLAAGVLTVVYWSGADASADDARGADGEAVRKRALRIAAAVGAATFVGAYAPYGLSRHLYLPAVGVIMDRLNGVGAWSAGIFLAAGLAALFRARFAAGRSVLFLILVSFTWTNAFVCLQWAVAWETQRSILANVSGQVHALPAASTVILAGAPRLVGGAPVFTESWDFDEALKIVSGRRDLSGRVVGRRMRFEKDFVAERPGAAHWPRTEEWRYPYRNLYLYRHDKRVLKKLDGPPASG
jgi:hypothetical protein